MSTTITQTLTDAVQSTSQYLGSVLYRSLHDDDRPLSVASSQGMWYTLNDGRKVLDCCGGAAVACLGNGNQEVIQAIKDQLDQCAFCYNHAFTTSPAEELADLLCKSSDGAFDRVAFVSGGSEAVEYALKLARQYFVEKKEPQRVNFITRKMCCEPGQALLHSPAETRTGNTLGSLGASNHPARRKMFEPILANDAFHHVEPAYPYRYRPAGLNDEQYTEYLKADLEKKFEELGGDTVIAFMCESVVGATSGAVVPPKGYFAAMRSVCDKYGALFILDEVMSGMGRTGRTHAWQAIDDGATRPDLQTVAKGLGAGFQPIGACLISPKVSDALRISGLVAGGFTYQAHAIACAAALAVQKVILREDLLSNVRTMSTYLLDQLRSRTAADPLLARHVGEVRGLGLLCAVEYVKDKDRFGDEPFGPTMRPRFAYRVSKLALDKQDLQMLSFSGGIDGTRGDFSLFAPAYNVPREEIDVIVNRYLKALKSAVSSL